jgi:hypothetical protein
LFQKKIEYFILSTPLPVGAILICMQANRGKTMPSGHGPPGPAVSADRSPA